ncbi:hypothetical protein AALA13_17770 [Lachnospiraceae bacterium 50-23]
MNNIKKIFSLSLALILFSTSFFSTANASDSKAIETIKKHNLEVIEVDEDFKKDALVFDTTEEFEEFIKKIESEEIKVENIEVEIEEDNLDTKLNRDNLQPYSLIRRTVTVTFDLPFPMSNIVTEAYFYHDSSTSKFGDFIGGDVYDTGFSLVTGVSDPRVEGLHSRGDMVIQGSGIYHWKVVVEGIGTFYKKPFTTHFVIRSDLSVSEPILRGL